MDKRMQILTLVLVLFGLGGVSCVPSPPAGRVRSGSEVVELGGADAVQVEIIMGAGELEINGRAVDLLEANYRSSAPDLLPDISYRVRNNGVGYLEIEQQEKPTNQLYSNYYNYWELDFNREIPLDISLVLGAGENNLNLDDLNLRSFTMQMGAGEANVDLGSAPSQDLEVDIQGGVGQLTVILPPDVNIEAEVSGGLGEINTSGLVRQGGVYLSEYAGSGPLVRITIEAGIGELNLLVE